MSKEYYKQAKKIFPKFNRETDTVIVGSSRDYNMAKRMNMFNRQRAALDLANITHGDVRRIDLANKESDVVTRSKDNNYYVYSLVDKDKAKNTVSPVNCWKGYERVPGTKPGAKGSCRKSSPANQNMKFDKANRERYEAMSQKTKDSLHHQANLYGKPFFSPKHQVNVDPEDGVLSNRPIYKDGSKLTYESIERPFTSPMKRATKGGGTTKVCLPKSKVNNMSAEEKKKVVSAKESAGRSGKRERSEKSEVKGARKKGATLRDWFEKENWVNVKTGQECGAPTKRETSKPSRGMKALKTAYDIGSTFLKGAPGVVATFLTPQTAYAHQDGEWVANPDGSKSFEKFDFYENNNDGGLLPKFEEDEEKTPLNKSNEPRKTTKGKGRNFRTVEEGAGMTEKGVAEYKKKNPGSNLQTAVTEKNPKGKRAARRKSFCARSRGWTGERGRAARRRWNC